MIERGLGQGQGDATSPELMLAAIQAGTMSLWAVHEGDEIQAGIVLSVLENPKGKKLYVELLAGTGMDEWVGDLEKTVLEAKALTGAMCVEASCRKGLARYLKRRGWNQKAVVMELR